MRKVSLAGFVVCCCAFAFVCFAEEVKPQFGGHLVWAQPYSVTTLDPHDHAEQGAWNVQYQIYEALVDTDPGYRPLPRLAVSWERPDANTWVFHLRQGVYWQDGNPIFPEGQSRELTAEDVVYTFKRVLNPELALVRYAQVAHIDEVEALDRYTVRFHTIRPDPFFLESVPGGLFIIPHELVEAGLIDKYPVGTGPFEFVSFKPEEEVVFKRNEDWWGGPVYLDGQTMKIIPQKDVAVMALEAGQVDLVDQVSPASIPRLRAEGFQLIRAESGAERWLGIPVRNNPPWDNVKMREALAHAVDREQIIKVVFAGVTEMAVPAYQHENPALETHDPFMNELPIWKYDLELARTLLAEEGWVDTDGDGIRDKDGKKLSIDILTPAADPNRVKIGVLLATVFRQELGIDATTTKLEWGILLERTRVLPPKNDVQAFIIGGYSGVNGLYYLFSSSTWGDGGNRTFYSNPEVDKLFEQALATTNRAERIELWKQAQRLIYQDIPQIPLYFDFVIAAAKSTVHGYVPWSRICDMYTQVWMEPGK